MDCSAQERWAPIPGWTASRALWGNTLAQSFGLPASVSLLAKQVQLFSSVAAGFL